MDLKRGIDKAVKAIVENLKSQSQEVGSDNAKIEQIATISANNDSSIGSLIAQAMAAVGNEGVTQNIFGLSAGNYTLTFYIKSNTDANQNARLLYGAFQSSSIVITPDWQRFQITYTANTSVDYNGILSNEAIDISIWGAQLEQGSYATSYIPTQGSIGTRVAESCVQTPPSGIIGQTEGTVYLESNNLYPSGTRTLGMLYTSGSAFYQIYLTSSNQIRVDINGALLMLSSAIDLSVSNKIAFAYKSAENVLYLNGVSLATSTSTSIPSSLNDFHLGNFNGNEQSGSFTNSKL
jgi:hypothetical protein